MVRKLAPILTVFILLSTAPAAEARAKRRAPIRYSPISAAYTLAARYWHQVPCSGHVTITTGRPPSNDAINPYEGATSMWSAWDVGTSNENNESAPLPFTSCAIGINSSVWTSEFQEAYEAWPEFSVDMIHEFGHLLGLPDLFEPTATGNIMYIEPSPLPQFCGETFWSSAA
jgi:hypothetical protein